MTELKNEALRALSCLDLTDLSDDCTSDGVRDLINRAQTPYGNVAAICIWPKFVAEAAKALRNTSIRVATVVNFPTGDEPASQVITMTQKAREDGADEIDMVIPWKALLEGHPENVSARVARVKAASDGAPVKAIIESGMLDKPELIIEATRGAIDGGADFVKTSTGKVRVNATPQAAQTILEVLKRDGGPVGFKVSGGVKTTQQAADYLAIADGIMGPDWVSPETFRFGASSVIDDLLAVISGKEAPLVSAGY